jgi:class 3 adenylate cyclase
VASGAESLLREEAWRSERAINVFRAVIWTTICAAILVGSLVQGDRFLPGVAAGLVYGVACAIVGATWLKRHYHDAVPYVGSALDVLVLAVIVDTTHRLILAEQGPEAASRQLYDMHGALMVLIAANALRFSWRASAWSVFCAAAVYVVLLLRHDRPNPVAMGVNVGEFLAVGAILGVAARKLRVVIHRVKERDAFARFLPEPVVERLTRDPSALALGGEQQEASVLFADIRGFTTLAERMQPVEVVAMLNEYFAEMVDEIFAHQGVLDKFIGDGICAVFTSRLGDADHAARALRCACGMLRRLDTINRARAGRGEAPLAIGVGVHSGNLVAGNIGSPLRLEYTHVGDTVNTASRLESLTKECGRSIVFSIETKRRLADVEFDVEDLGEKPVRGRDPIRLFSVR